MPSRITIDEILRFNPYLSSEELEQIRELLHKLREGGVKKADYGLAPIFGGRRVSVDTGERGDPRTVRLRSKRMPW